jgi:PhnB protein
MSMIREVYPYLSVRGAAAAIEFYQKVFEAQEIFRMNDPANGRIGHAELKLGPLTIMLADEYPELGILSPLAFGGSGLTIHLHVENVDVLAQRALQAGATMVREPADYSHGERQCRVRDPFGHEWLLGHEIGKTPGPEVAQPPVQTIYPGIRFRDERAAMDWLGRAFGFERHAVYEGEDGAIVHAELKLGPGLIMLGSAPEDGLGFSIYVYVEDLDTHYARARAAGAEIVRPLGDTSYGTREYGARDLEGHLWFFGTYLPAERVTGIAAGLQ